MFNGLSNIIDIKEDSAKKLELFITPEEFIAAYKKELENMSHIRKQNI